jgi:hypothetical protein
MRNHERRSSNTPNRLMGAPATLHTKTKSVPGL